MQDKPKISQGFPLTIAVVAVGAFFVLSALADSTFQTLLKFLYTLIIGYTLYRTRFGFTGSFRKLISARNPGSFVAQMIMVAINAVLFAPIFAAGTIGSGENAITVSAAAGTVSPFIVVGSFVFGLGMQLSCGCASGHLVEAGMGSSRSWFTLIFFGAGAIIGVVAVPELEAATTTWQGTSIFLELGYVWGAVVIVICCAILSLLAVWWGTTAAGSFGASWAQVPEYLFHRPVPMDPAAGRARWTNFLVFDSWAPFAACIVVPVMNALMLLSTGGTWGCSGPMFTVPARLMYLIGIDVQAIPFFSGGPTAASPLLENGSIYSDLGVILGASAASSLTGGFGALWTQLDARSVFASTVGGFLLGFGSRMAHGCNIGGYYSPMASGAVSSYVWLIGCVLGCALGVFLRPFHGLHNEAPKAPPVAQCGL